MTVTTTVLNVPGLRCAACISKLEGGLARVDGVVNARVNFTNRRVVIAHSAEIDSLSLRDAIGRIGFPSEPFVGETEAPADSETKMLARALAVAGFASMNIMLLSVSIWAGADPATRQLFHWLSAAIALPATAYAGRPFFTSAWAALRRGRTNMDVPIAIGVTLTVAMSLYETITGGRHAYFDGAMMLLFFLLAGRLLDSVMRARAQDGVAALQRQRASRGLILLRDGSSEWRDADEIAPGMMLLVAVGEHFAADGTVSSGRSLVDRSLVTGESAPEFVTSGDAVLAGTINLDAPLTVRVTAAAESTAIAGMARLMEAASGSKSRYVRIADRAARLYAPAVHSLALLSFVGWMVAGAGVHQSILIAVAVLIITCPCALGLAVPVSQVVAAGALMRKGVLIKDGSALERLVEADVALFDKTGTLTLGRPVPAKRLELSAIEASVALALARASRHPVSRALASALDAQGIEAAEVEEIEEQPGSGVSALSDGQTARLGRPDWLDKGHRPDSPVSSGLVTAFEFAGGPIRLLAFDDALRPDAAMALARLGELGLEPMVISGDRDAAARAIADPLGIKWQAEMTPQAKFAFIEQLQKDGQSVLMVGDGINDGPALSAAHVSIAPSSASDVGQTAADIVFFGDALSPVPIAIVAARRTMRIVRQNFALAIAYNVVAVPLAMSGLVTPLIAAVAMSCSSLLVVANALRLKRCTR